MNIIDRYIARHILPACLLVAGVIWGLDMLLVLSGEVAELGEEASFLQVFTSVLYGEPYRAYSSMPLILLLGSIIGLGTLANNHELVSIRAAGISVRRLSMSVLLAILPLLLMMFLVGEYVVPLAQQASQFTRAEYTDTSKTKSFWLKDGNNYVSVGSVVKGDNLRDVVLYGYSGLHWQTTIYADSAHYENDQWLLKNGYQQELVANKLVSTPFAQKPWSIELSTDLVAKLSTEPQYLASKDLYQYANYLQKAGINADLFYLAFWKKILQPLFALCLVLVAISFVFGSPREVPLGQRVLWGTLLGLGFSYAQDILGPVSTIYGLSPILAYALPIVISFFVSWWLLRRAR